MKSRLKVVLLLEEVIAFASCAVIIFLPLLDKIIQKTFPGGIPNSNTYVAYSIIALCFSASILTTKEKKHLSLGLLEQYAQPKLKNAIQIFNTFVSLSVSVIFFMSSLSFVFTGIEASKRVGPIPERVFILIMPLAFLIIAVYFLRYSELSFKGKLFTALAAYPVGLLLSLPAATFWIESANLPLPQALQALSAGFTAAYPVIHIAWVVVLLIGAVTGVPIFIVLGGLAFTFFTNEQVPITAIPTEWHMMLRGDMLPALPLFTITGYILAESQAGKRLIELMKNIFGWLPGGMIIVAVLVCTFFTTFTGASGVTILALGLLLALILKESGGYSDNFIHGLITGSGSIGLLLPPSLAVIMYGVFASLDIKLLFLNNLMPGLLLVLSMCAAGIIFSIRTKAPTFPFIPKAAGKSILVSFWEILLPLLVIFFYFLGILSIPETAALSVVYVIVVEVLIRKEIPLKKLPGIILKALSVVGGTLIILAAARGLALYIIDAQIPEAITGWVASWIHSQFLFLIFLNLLLLVVGCFLDVFSAIMVVAPLLFPMAAHFGVNPYHLAAIFLTNLGIGYLTPPVGMNLFLASYTFNQPLTKIYKRVLPFMAIQLVILLLVTFIPWFSTAFIPVPK
jgi:C4-dicarboxylate transporter, DctM subunit